MKTEGDCRSIQCCSAAEGNFSPFTFSLVNGASYTNEEATFVIPCPPGYSCESGSITITLPPGFVDFKPVDFNPNPPSPGNPYDPAPGTYTFTCGTQQLVITTATTFTAAQITQIVDFLAQCAATTQGYQALRPAPPGAGPDGTTFYSNDAVYNAPNCEAQGKVLTVNGSLPSWVTVEINPATGNRLVGKPGTFTKSTKLLANAAAQTALDNFVAAAFVSGLLTCNDPNPPVPGSCIDFTSLNWIEVSLSGNANWVAALAEFQTTATSAAVPNDVSEAVIDGEIAYGPGPAVDCVINYNVADLAGIGEGSIVAVSNLHGILAQVDLDGIGTGPHTLPFTIPEDLTNTQSIQIIVTCRTDSGAGAIPGTLDVDGIAVCLDECFFNAEATAHTDCGPSCIGPGGNGTVTAGEIPSKISQQDADDRALAIAQQEADDEAEINCACPPDWSQMSWGNASIVTANSGTASFSPSNTTGNPFSAAAAAPQPPAFPPLASNNGLASNVGTLISGVALGGNCNLSLSVGGTEASPGGFDYSVEVKVDGVSVGSATYPAVGVINIPFNVDGAFQVDVIVSCNASKNNLGAPGPSSVTVTGTLSNV